MGNNLETLLENFIDWKDFEKFVAGMYSDDSELKVEHNVTLIGTSGRKRQVDVLVTQTTKLHTYKTLIECKFLKTKVDGDVVDKLAAAIEDLKANKGAIITTIGYEAGAIDYAKSKNIDIFLIRNVLDNEWGNATKIIRLWLQLFSFQVEGFAFDNARYVSLKGNLPPSGKIDLNIGLSKDMVFEERHQLYSFPALKKGPNLIKMLIDIGQKLLQQLNENTIGLLAGDSEDKALRIFRSKAHFDFKNYSFNHLPHGEGYITFDKITVPYLFSISQSKIEHDKTKDFDYVLMVENYITKQRNFVGKKKEDSGVSLSSPVQNETGEDLSQGRIIKVTTDYYVGIVRDSNIKIEDINDVYVNLEIPK